MSFNSTMVRLKVTYNLIIKCQDREFQFHNGSIKSSDSIKEISTYTMFQFHNGSIKRNHQAAREANYEMFQFHNGSIKRSW